MKKYKTALVTGGCQRIGLSIVKYLASKGLNIVVQYNNVAGSCLWLLC